MRLLPMLLFVSAVGAHAQEVPCTFVISTAATFGGWHVIDGRAEVKGSGSRFFVQLFGDSKDSSPTHTLKGIIRSGRVAATLVNHSSDAGSDKVTGHYAKTVDPYSGPTRKVFESLIAHSGTVAVGVKCYGETPGLTSHSSGSAGKAAQAAQFNRWAS